MANKKKSKIRLRGKGRDKPTATGCGKRGLGQASRIKKCPTCQIEINPLKRRNRFCGHKCAAIYNNARRTSEAKECPQGRERFRSAGRHCSQKCDVKTKRERYIAEWKAGTRSGLDRYGRTRPAIKRYLREKFKDRCSECNWHKINPFTGKVPLNADHIDGDWRNNKEDNLRLLCGCCDSLTKTYAGGNRGKGRGSVRPNNPSIIWPKRRQALEKRSS